MLTQLTRLFLLAFIIVPQAVDAQQKDGATAEATQVISTDAFDLRIPASWTQIEDPKTILTLVSPHTLFDASFRENIRIKKYPLSGVNDLDKISAAQEQSVEDQFEVIGSGILTKDEPRITWLAVTEKQPESGPKKLAKIDYMMIDQEHLLVIHAMCEKETLNENQPTFDAIARSVSLRRPIPTPQTTTPNLNHSRKSAAYEQGKQVGRYLFYAMSAAVVGWTVFRLFKSFRKKAKK